MTGSRPSMDSEQNSCTFSKLMMRQNKICPAVPHNPNTESLMSNSGQNSLPTHPIFFEALDGALIQQVAQQCNHAASPTRLDIHTLRGMCTSFKQASWDLCSAIAGIAHCICTKSVDPEVLSTLVMCRLLPLNKCPRVRPISVGEVLRYILGKVVMRIARLDMVIATGSSQVCAGLEGGCKAAVHAMKTLKGSHVLMQQMPSTT